MLLFAGALGAGIVSGLVRGGRIHRLSVLPIRHEWMIMTALILRAALFVVGEQGVLLPMGVVAAVQGASYGLLLWAVWLNGSAPGLRVLGLGASLNAAVILANGGRMPVSYEAAVASGQAEAFAALSAVTSYLHQAAGPATRLAFLGDVLAFPAWIPIGAAFSIGDVLILAGVFILIQRTMLTPCHKRQRSTCRLEDRCHGQIAATNQR